MKYLIIMLALFLCVGCVSVEFDRNTGIMKYNRWFGGQKLSGLEVDVNADGSMHVELDSQEAAEAKALIKLTEAVGDSMEIMKKVTGVATGVPIP